MSIINSNSKRSTTFQGVKLLFLICVLFFMALLCPELSAQGWLYLAEAPANTKWRPNDVIETPKQEFLISYWDYDKTSTIIKLSAEGVLQSSRAITAPDTTIIISKLIYDEVPSVFTAVGLCIPASGEKEAVLTLKFDENLSVLHRKVVSCTGLSQSLLNIASLKQNDGFKIAFTEQNYTHHLAKFNLDGELLEWKKLEVDSLRTICNLFEMVEDDNAFGMYAHITSSSDAAMGVLVFDDSLQLVRRTHFNQWEHVENEGNVSVNGLYDSYNSMMMPNPDHSGYYISSRFTATIIMPFQSETSSIIAKTDLDFVMQDEYHVIEHFNDTIEYPAFFKSIDCYSSSGSTNNLYHCCVLGIHEGWPYIPLTVIVTKIDEDFNIVWEKRLLTGLGYSPYSITATSDGGCIVVGWVYDFNSEQRLDLFALKVNADGTVGLDELQEENMAFVYPNPAKVTIRIRGVEAKETMVFNSLGQCIMSFRGNEANVEDLSAGVYLLRITDREGLMQTLRLVVDK